MSVSQSHPRDSSAAELWDLAKRWILAPGRLRALWRSKKLGQLEARRNRNVKFIRNHINLTKIAVTLIGAGSEPLLDTRELDAYLFDREARMDEGSANEQEITSR